MFYEHLRLVEVTSSTNSLLKAEAEAGLAQEGTVIMAEHQTSGKGRLERSWEAPPGKALLLSILLYPRSKPEWSQLIGLMISLAVFDSLQQFFAAGADASGKIRQALKLKWPNDILVDNRKICGILSESGISRDGRRFIVAGIGLNVNQTPEDFPANLKSIATSVAILAGRSVSRDIVLRLLLDTIETYYNRLNSQGIDWLIPAWMDRAVIIGKRLVVRQHDGMISGICAGMEKDGSLLIQLENGVIEKVYSGDVQP